MLDKCKDKGLNKNHQEIMIRMINKKLDWGTLRIWQPLIYLWVKTWAIKRTNKNSRDKASLVYNLVVKLKDSHMMADFHKDTKHQEMTQVNDVLNAFLLRGPSGNQRGHLRLVLLTEVKCDVKKWMTFCCSQVWKHKGNSITNSYPKTNWATNS